MTEDLHARAGHLIDAVQVEGISAADREWLDNHLEGCARCGARARATERALQSLRSAAFHIDPAVVRATQLRVRLRAQQLREQQSRMRALWVSCALSWVLGVVSAPLLWRGFEWLGRSVALPDSVWQIAFFLWWPVPAVVAGGVLAWWRVRASTEDGYTASLPR